MLKYVITLAALAVPFAAAHAHPDHDADEPMEQTAEQVAKAHVIRMVTQAKLAPSWSKAAADPTQTRRVRGQAQSVIPFRNPAEPQPRRVLYVVVANGAVVSAEHALR